MGGTVGSLLGGVSLHETVVLSAILYGRDMVSHLKEK
jgi:hypothetical protein